VADSPPAETMVEADHTGDSTERVGVWAGINKPVFIPATVIIFVLIGFSVFAASDSQRIFGDINAAVVEYIGWWYILVVAFFVVFAFYCGLSRIGNVRLGRDDEVPEFGVIPWFAMLFSAGMGIGLVFWGVAEPLNHYVNPPSMGGEQAEGIAAADQALELTMFHWGLSAWAIYVVVGLGLAYMTYRRGRPLSIRWLLEPLLGRERVEGPIGHAVDATAIVGTLFGVATSLGLGVQQILAGLVQLGWVAGPSNWSILGIILLITGIATFSVLSGVDKGLKWLSNINMGLAAMLLLFVLLLGPTVFLLQAWVGNLGGYLSVLPEYMLRTAPFDNADPINDPWLGNWTIFYWGWWMSWAPFVGMFIARISRGRTIRQFVFGVLLAPTLVASVWFTVFGDSALIRQIEIGDMVGLDGVVDTNTSLFLLLEGLPLSSITSVLAILVIGMFFITSSDSGSLVIDMLANGGRTNTPRITRVYWAVLEGVSAAVLLIAGGSAALLALQTASIITAVPISIVLVLACVSLIRAFRYEVAKTPQYFEIVDGIDGLGAPVADGEVPPMKDAAAASATLAGLSKDRESRLPKYESDDLLVTVRSINPAVIEFDAETGAPEVARDPYGPNPLSDEVFNTPEFEESAEGAALARAEHEDS
jgi:choline/glycine/proline betaine transport protein